MSVYSISLFLDVLAALVLFAAMGLEWMSLYHLPRAATLGQVREWIKPLAAGRFGGGPSALLLLVTGIYMGVTRWGGQAWMGLGLVGLVLMAGLGAALSGRRYARLVQALPASDGPIPPALAERLRDPLLVRSAWVRSGLGGGVIYLMTAKPGPLAAAAALGTFALAGLALGAVTGWRRAAPEPSSLPR